MRSGVIARTIVLDKLPAVRSISNRIVVLKRAT